MNKWGSAPKMGELEQAMMAKFDKADEDAKLRNMSQAERDALQEEDERVEKGERRWKQKFDSAWHKKNKRKRSRSNKPYLMLQFNTWIKHKRRIKIIRMETARIAY